MGIWEYKAEGTDLSLDIVDSKYCIFCQAELASLDENEKRLSKRHAIYNTTRVCSLCGWWSASSVDVQGGGVHVETTYGAYGSLRHLNLTDVTTPIEEVRAFLLAQYDRRFSIHPRLFEETVGSIFRDLGYTAEVTAYQNDGGIDVILRDSSGARIGVQVKRYKDRISVDQIRSLTGALLIGGFSKGVFVTTSSFQAGASKTANLSAAKGIPIELINAERLYDVMKIGARAPYASLQDWKDAVGDIKMQHIDHWNS